MKKPLNAGGLIRYLREVFSRMSRTCASALLFTALSFCSSTASPKERIVSLAPSITETLFALGAGDQVVGVSSYDDYPPEVANLPKVGSFLTPNLEAIVALRPTLIVALGISSNQREIRAIRELGYPILMVDDASLAQIEDSISAVGARAGKTQEARGLNREIEDRVSRIRARVANQPEPRVLMLVGHKPMVAAGRGTFLDDLIRIARGANIADASNEQWPSLSLEYVIASRPDVILDGQMGSDPSSPAGFWSAFPAIPAVRERHVYGYPQNPTLHPGPRVVATLQMIATRIHPEIQEPAR